MDDFKEYIENRLKSYSHYNHYLSILSKHMGTEKILFIPPDDNLVVNNPHYFSKKTAEYIFNELSQKGWDYSVIFVLPSESFGVSYMKYMDLAIKILIKDYQLSYFQFGYLTGAADTDFNRRIYYKHCIELNHLPIKLYFINTFETIFSHSCTDEVSKYEYSLKKKKKILFLNGVVRPHRVIALGQIIKRNLLDKTMLSFNSSASDIFDIATHLNRNYYPNLTTEALEHIEILKDQLPINLTLGPNKFNMHKPNYDDYLLFNDSLFSLITETLYCNNHEYVPHDCSHIHCYNSNFYTEKTYRAMLFKHPFLLLTTPYALQGLRQLGYKTFHPYIDESYDTISGEEERLLAVMDEVERLSNMSEDEELEWLKNVQDICQHNYEVLESRHTFSITNT